MTQRSVLIVAHPGHELLLHRWLEIERPAIFALTDGSGSRGTNRTDRSRAIIGATGSRAGSVFGQMTDQEWYAAILNGNMSPFIAAARGILDDLTTPPGTVVVDAVEHFNPMHDLTAVVAALVARWSGAERLLCYAIENDPAATAPVWTTELDDEQWGRKCDAARNYLELAAEVDAFAGRSDRLKREALFAVDLEKAFPERLAVAPYYESFGNQRVREGRFSDVIIYDRHVRPLAQRLLASD